MVPTRESHVLCIRPVVVWTLAVLNVLVFLWDRGFNAFGQPTAFVDLALKPLEVSTFFQRSVHADALVPVKVFTSMFLHFNLVHLLGNMFVLLVFGPSVEQALGGPKFGLLYLVSGIVAAAAHVFVNAGSFGGLQGASGAIGGVLGAYFLLFPAAKVEISFLFTVTAWVFLGIWFVGQLFLPQPGVANWAHVGGFAAGMAYVLLLGGPKKILTESPVEEAV